MTAITVTKTSPLGCDITATLGAVTGTGMLTLANDTNTRTTTRGRWIAGTEQCGNARRQLHTATDNREISGPSTASATMTVSSLACQLIGTTSFPVTCKN